MNDRELLELAAKAAEIAYWRVTAGGVALDDAETELWNPLKNDGDALRLAVNLRFAVDVRSNKTYVGGQDGYLAEERGGTDPYAATRRAIVRAAAEIARAMP